MSQARHTATKLLPVVGITAAAGAAGLWAWRGKNDVSENRENGVVPAAVREESTAVTAVLPTEPAEERIGPMVAVYLDQPSVKKLQEKYPETAVARLQKVVIQYNPSDKQRGLYEPHFGGSATVQLTGRATSAERHALMASVSLAGRSVEPQSLSCAMDVTPGNLSGGPLGSAALIEQIKQAGATAKDVPWKGLLPPLSAHGRDYPSEDGCYDKLDAPVTVTGSICRADWVEGTTGRCRTLTEEGDKRTDGWTPQGCIICNTLEASPCRDAYKIYDGLSARIKELEREEMSERPAHPDDIEESEDESDQDIEASDDAQVSRRVADDARGEEAGEGEGDGGGGGGGAHAERQGAVEGDFVDGEDHERERRWAQRDAEMCKLDTERTEAMIDMMRCSSFHSVMEDWTADAGVTHGGDEDEDDYDDDDVIEAGGGGDFEGGSAGSVDGGASEEELTARDEQADASAKKS